MRDVGHPLLVEDSLLAPRSRSASGTKRALVQDVCDLGVDVVLEKRVDHLDDLGRRLDLLSRGLRVVCRQRFGSATLEANMDLGEALGLELDESDVLNETGQQPLPLPTGCRGLLIQVDALHIPASGIERCLQNRRCRHLQESLALDPPTASAQELALASEEVLPERARPAVDLHRQGSQCRRDRPSGRSLPGE